MTQTKFLTFFMPALLLLSQPRQGFTQKNFVTKDSVVYKITFRDTIVYRYDTVRIRHFIHSDTVSTSPGAAVVSAVAPKRKGWYNPNSWGIGPSVGAYYSPFHGFDVNIGFGVQYYLFAIPSFRNPHMGGRKKKK